MAATTSADEFVVMSWEWENVRRAQRASRAAWSSYCSSILNLKDQIIDANGSPEAAASTAADVPNYVSHFLTDCGVRNLFLIPAHYLDHQFDLQVVIRGSVGKRWGREDMLLSTWTWDRMDPEECLRAIANFGGSLYLLYDPIRVMEVSTFCKALCDSPTPPHTLSVRGDFPGTLPGDDHLNNIITALHHNSKIRNLALWGRSHACGFNNISMMEGIALDRLYLKQVDVTDAFLKALPSSPYRCSVTHSLTLDFDFIDIPFGTNCQYVWESSFSEFLHWQLKHLHLLGFSNVGPQELIDFMECLRTCNNTSLHSLSLGSLGVSLLNEPLVGTVVDTLHQSSLPSLHIYASGPPTRLLHHPAIDAQLLRNQQKHSNTGFALLEAQHKVPAAAVRMFICGDPFAGKTTLLSALSSICAASSVTSLVSKVKECFLPSLCFAQHERTRGIEIRRITKDGIQLSLWDLAGQREFHAFHDLMFPDPSGGYGSPTMFMFVWSPVESKDESRGKTKSPEDFNASFLYWLKFIASKTRQSNILRKLILVITRKDQIDLLEDALASSIKTVAANFGSIIEVVEVLAVDARDPICVKPLASCILKTARAVLEGVKIYSICSVVSKYLSSQEAQKSLVRESPIISWKDFGDLCRGKFQVDDVNVQKAIASTLNDSGEVIYLGNLPFLVLDPNWFCHEIVGTLLHFHECNESRGFLPIDGYTEQDYLEKVLKRSTYSKVEGSVLVSLMEAMHLCYRDSSEKGGKIFIPATLSKSKTGSPRQWRMMEAEDEKYSYVGRRLECDRKDVTFFTPGLFPMIQVVFGKAFSGEEADVEMVEECMSICMLDMEIIVEFGRGKLGHIMDVMARASAVKNGGRNILAYVEEEIVKTLIKVCAQPEGNQGVTLVESIIRPDCLLGPAPLHVRDDQCILVLELKEKLRKQLEALGETRQLQHLWKSRRYVQPTTQSFMDLLGFEVYMDVLMSYKESLRDASVSLSHVPRSSTSCSHHELPYADSEDGQILEGNVDAVSLFTTSTSLQDENDICSEITKESNSLIHELGHHAKNCTNDSVRPSMDSFQQEATEDGEDVGKTDESQEQIVDSMGKGMVKAIYELVRSINARLKAMDARQKDMERKVDDVLDSIKRMQSDVLPRIQAVVQQCFNFAVESEAGRTPRFVFLTDDNVGGGKAKRRMVMASLFTELKRVHIELCCEHRGRPHRVDGQEGVSVTIVDDKEAFVVKALPYVKGFLKMLTVVAKVGAHAVAGAGSMVPDLAQLIASAFSTPGLLDSQSSFLRSTPVAVDSLGGWQEWLESVLERKGGTGESNIYDKFKLRRVRFRDNGKVAWLCDEHYQQCEVNNLHSNYY